MLEFIRPAILSLKISVIMLINWIVVYAIVFPIHRIWPSNMLFLFWVILSILLLLYISCLPTIQIKKAFGKRSELDAVALYLTISFVFVVIMFQSFIFALHYTLPEIIIYIGLSKYNILFIVSNIIGHIAAFIIQLVKYFKQKGVGKQ